MRGVAGLELHGQSPNASPSADGGTSAAAAPPTRPARAGIRASAPPRCPRRAGCRPRGCGQRYGLPLGVDESATGPIVAILRERQPDVLLTHVANAPVPPGPQPGTGDHPADAQDRPGPRPPPRTRPLVAAQRFQLEPRRPQVCEVHLRPAAGQHTRIRRRDQGGGLHDRTGPQGPSELTAIAFPACPPGVSAQGGVKADPSPVTAPAVVAGTTSDAVT
jgi:hypothetical protein